MPNVFVLFALILSVQMMQPSAMERNLQELFTHVFIDMEKYSNKKNLSSIILEASPIATHPKFFLELLFFEQEMKIFSEEMKRD